MKPEDPNDLSAHHDDPLNFDDEDLLTAEDRLADDDFPETKSVTLGDIWRNNPSLKIFAVALVIGVFLIVFMVFGGEEEPNLSQVGGSSNVNQAPGTAQLPPAYEDAVKAASEQRAVDAETSGGSSLPTPIGTAERIEAPPAIENIDPLQEWRAAAQERVTQRREQAPVTLAPPPVIEAPPVIQQPVVVQPPPQPPAPPPLPTGPDTAALQQLTQTLSMQMKTILDNQVPNPSVVVGLGIPTGFERTAEQKLAQAAALQNQSAMARSGAAKPPRIIIPAGTIAYAQTLLEANSDVPGPVLAELASGPLTGARLIGSFSMADEYLTLQFARAIYKGKEYSINAIAIDPATTLPALATDVNHHYFSRVMIPAAARFLQGYAQAIARQGTTVVVNNSSVTSSTEALKGRDQAIQGASEAFNQIAQVAQQNQNRPITVKVASGTRMGLLFTSSLTENAADPGLVGTPAYQTDIQAAATPTPIPVGNLPPYMANAAASQSGGVVTAPSNSGMFAPQPVGTKIVTPVTQ